MSYGLIVALLAAIAVVSDAVPATSGSTGALRLEERDAGHRTGTAPVSLNVVGEILGREAAVFYVDSQFDLDRGILVRASASGFGSFQGGPLGPVSGDVAAGDVRRDGFDEVVVPDPSSGGIWIGGSLVDPRMVFHHLGGRPTAVAIANWDLDRDDDLAVIDEAIGSVRILINDGGSPPSFREEHQFELPDQPRRILVADLDTEEPPDFITTHDHANGAEVVAYTSFGTASGVNFARRWSRVIDAEASSARLGDLDGDGARDLVMLDKPGCAANSTLVIQYGLSDHGPGSPLRETVSCPIFSGGRPCPLKAFAVGDFTGDGTDDVALFAADPRPRIPPEVRSTGLLWFLVGWERNFFFGPVIATPVGAVGAVSGDLDGNGSIDLIGAFSDPPQLRLFDNASRTANGASNGEPCTEGESCLSGTCEEGTCCATECAADESCAVPNREGICIRPIALSSALPCADDSECFDIPSPGDPGFCVDGACCNTRCSGGRCNLPGAWGICVSLAANGKECCRDDECASGSCRDGRCCADDCAAGYCGNSSGQCVTALQLGDDCDRDEECESGICDRFDGVCCAEVCAGADSCNIDPGVCVPPPTITPPPTRTPTPVICSGDCNGDGAIRIDDIVLGASIALANADVAPCASMDRNSDGRLSVAELVRATWLALTGCSPSFAPGR